MASIDKVLAQIGADNVKVQYLGECMTNIKTGKNETEISFVTQELTANDAVSGSTKTAMIVWVDSTQYNRAVAEIKELEKGATPETEKTDGPCILFKDRQLHITTTSRIDGDAMYINMTDDEDRLFFRDFVGPNPDKVSEHDISLIGSVERLHLKIRLHDYQRDFGELMFEIVGREILMGGA